MKPNIPALACSLLLCGVACGSDTFPHFVQNEQEDHVDASVDPASTPTDQAPDANETDEHQHGVPDAGTPDAAQPMPPSGDAPAPSTMTDVSALTLGSRNALSVPLAVDINPDPNVIEVNLHASVSKVDIGSRKLDMYTFNGQVPGPRIEGKVGDKVIVHFTNHLPEATMVHWHGLRVPNSMDGTPLVQPDVLPNGKFDYTFELTDPGIYWYHPHLDSSEQLMKGLYAPIVVRGEAEPANSGDELTLVLSDLSYSSTGVVGFAASGDNALADGRDGDTVLINGKEARTLLVQPGSRLRLRFLNAAANRYFRVGVEGHKLTRIGAEGGLSTAASEAYYLLLANAERADVVLLPKGKAGDQLKLVAVPYDRGTGGTAAQVVLANLQLVGDQAEAPQALPTRLREIEPLSATGATEVDIRIERMDNHYMVNGDAHHAPPVVAHVGETQHWRVSNITYYDHPFHVHGYFFQVVDPATGKPKEPIEWRDTVNIPQSGQLELLIKFEGRPGAWMYHCHILDHAEVGFMGMLNVEP